MKITIACIGRLKGAEQDICDRYLLRTQKAGKSVGFQSVNVLEYSESRQKNSAERKKDESQSLLKKMTPGSFMMVLDENGRHFTSEKFTQKLAQLVGDQESLYLCLGGADGLDHTLLQNANMKLALGEMTLPHGLARAVLLEQLYRSVTILSGHPYHRE